MTTPNQVLESFRKTLPLNVALNNAFGKRPFEAMNENNFETQPIEVLNRIVPQLKLVLHEIKETIDAGEDLEENMDGIGDIITTADGLLGFVQNNYDVEQLVEENDVCIDLEGVEHFRSGGFEATVADIMASLYATTLATYKTGEAGVEVHNDPSLKFVSKMSIVNYGEIAPEQLIETIVEIAAMVRYGADTYSRHLGFCPVKILEEVQKSNMSKLCPTYESAVATLAKYNKEGLEAIEIRPAGIEGMYQVAVTEEVEYKGQVLPVGKFMKDVGFKKPDFSDKTRFEL